MDKNHRTPAAAQASSNIVRCTLAAVAIAFLQDMIDVMGIGWTFTFMGGTVFDGCRALFVGLSKGDGVETAGLPSW